MFAPLAITFALATSALFSATDPLQLEIEAPLRDLVTHERADDYAITGAMTVVVDGKPVRIDGVRISLRGHTSRRETECDFPKLKVAFPERTGGKIPLFAGLNSIKLGTHCGEAPDGTLTPKYGRLANEHSPIREAFVYRLLAAVEVPTLLARRARVTYRDTAEAGGAGRQSLVRNALVIEDQDDAVRRVGGTREIVETSFSNARDQLTPADTVRLAFAEALIGNFDWCLKMTPDDTYRCDARHALWNIVAADRGGGRIVPMIYDFDVAGIVTGRHLWFKDTFTRAFAPSASEAEIDVIAQLQRARALFARRDLDQARAAFVARKPQAFQALTAADLDPDGAAVATRYLESFYAQIESDDNFYRPVVRTPKTQAYTAADGAPACGSRSTVPIGTPVSPPLQRSGERVQVMLLDAFWHWTGTAGCQAIRRGPVWIDASAIGTDFPPR
jgi:hypothetical protein